MITNLNSFANRRKRLTCLLMIGNWTFIWLIQNVPGGVQQKNLCLPIQRGYIFLLMIRIRGNMSNQRFNELAKIFTKCTYKSYKPVLISLENMLMEKPWLIFALTQLLEYLQGHILKWNTNVRTTYPTNLVIMMFQRKKNCGLYVKEKLRQ